MIGETLKEIGLRTKTDKISLHNYHVVYERHFGPLRLEPITLLEIGVLDGASLRMWEEYFTCAKIYGIDIDPRCKQYETRRSKVFIGNQKDPYFLNKMLRTIGNPDIVIDDGGHKMDEQQLSFKLLFPYIKPGGVYVIEDLETSYYEKWGGGPIGHKKTTISLLKSFLDVINRFAHGGDRAPAPAEISGMHFYKNIAFIERGRIL